MSYKRGRLISEQQEEPLRRAREAAASGDTLGMVEALYESYALDGLTRLIKSRWDFIPLDEVRFIVASAVDVLRKAVGDGEKVLNIVGFLFKVCSFKAHQYYEAKKREKEVTDDLSYRLPKSQPPEQEISEPLIEDDDESSWEEKRKRAITIARELIPKLGQKNIQDVMTIIIDAIEAGREDLPNTEIAEILQLSLVNVRKLRQRGFERLTQRAREEGIITRTMGFVELGLDEDSPSPGDLEED